MRRAVSILLAALVVGACASLETGVDFDRSASFSGYRSFAWLPRAHPAARNPLNERRVQDAIRAELEAKGLRFEADLGRADLAVDFSLSSQERTDIMSYPADFRGPWRWGGGYFGNEIDVRQYREGTLAIDFFEARSHQPVWHGWAKKALSREDVANPEGGIRTAVAAVLGRFPSSPQPAAR
jgi:hypothetical protein